MFIIMFDFIKKIDCYFTFYFPLGNGAKGIDKHSDVHFRLKSFLFNEIGISTKKTIFTRSNLLENTKLGNAGVKILRSAMQEEVVIFLV